MVKYRRAGSLESFFAWAGSDGAFRIVCRVGLCGVIDLNRLIDSIETAVERDPFLSATLKHPETWLTAIEVGSRPPVISMLPRNSSHHWQQIFELELNRSPLEPHSSGLRPNVRAVIMHGTNQHDLLLSLEHALCDGRSMIGFIRAVVSIYNQHPQKSLDSVCEDAKLLTPPLEALVSIRSRADAFLRSLSNRTVIRTAAQAPQRFPLLDGNKVSDHNRIAFDTLSAEETATIVGNARTYELTLTEFLAVRLAELQQANARDRRTTEFQLSVDLRHPLGIEDPYQSGVYSFWDNLSLANDEDAYSVIRHWVRHAKYVAGIEGCVPPLGFRMMAGPFLTLCDRVVGPIATSDLSLSNLGRLSLPEYSSGITVESMHFAASQKRLGSLLQVTAASVRNRLCLACVTRSGVSCVNGRFVLSELIDRLLKQSHTGAPDMVCG